MLGEGEVWEGHDLLGQVGPEVLVHGGVDGETIVILANIVTVHPGPANTATLFKQPEMELC